MLRYLVLFFLFSSGLCFPRDICPSHLHIHLSYFPNKANVNYNARLSCLIIITSEIKGIIFADQKNPVAPTYFTMENFTSSLYFVTEISYVKYYIFKIHDTTCLQYCNR
jgi:hypothetical protein